MALLTIPFVAINKCGSLPTEVQRNFGFLAGAPLREWFYRTYISDFLSENPIHYVCLLGLTFATLPAVERRFGALRTLACLSVCSFFDDFVSYLLIAKPLQFLDTSVYESLIAGHEVGMSLVLFLLLGFEFSEFKRYRKTLLAIVSAFMIAGLIFTAPKSYAVIVQINHLLFFGFGYAFSRINRAMIAARTTRSL